MAKSEQCSNDSIPRDCADKFSELRAGQREIKTLLETHINADRTFVRRAWDVAKGVTLLIVGYLLGTN